MFPEQPCACTVLALNGHLISEFEGVAVQARVCGFTPDGYVGGACFSGIWDAGVMSSEWRGTST